jgi:acyl carrier protein
MHHGHQPGRQRLYATIGAVLDAAPESLDGQSSPDTLPRWDSLNHLNLAVAIETEFGVSLSPQDVLDMRSVELIETILRDHGVDI